MKPVYLSIVAGALIVAPLARARTFALPAKSGAPGSEVAFPVTLDVASGCASIQIELNYDSQVLEYVGFDAGTGLGSQFLPTTFAENGVVTLIWTRATGLVSGSGSLGQVTFRVNDGAEPGVITPLAIANFETSDETGVVEFALTETVEAVAGSLTVSGTDPDSDGDGIPDAWEIANFLDPDSSNFETDSDHDGRSDFLEYAFGGNPHVADPARSPSGGAVNEAGSDYLSLSFDRRKSSGLVYRVLESSSLGSWAEVTQAGRLVGAPTDHGDGTERVTVRSSFRMDGTGASPTGFMKLEVENP